jgi:hypothetical protein
MTDREIRITPRTGPATRVIRAVGPLIPIALMWLFFLTNVISATFAGKVFYVGRSTPPGWITYQDKPGIFVFLIVVSLTGSCFFGWVLLGLFPRRD